MPDSPFDDLARELPDGAFWPTGAWLKRVFAALTADRARAGANVDELPTGKGRFFSAKAGGGGSSTDIPPLTVVDASAKDSQGTPHPGRVRVYNGFLGNLRPAEMRAINAVLPNGTDNHCYLTMQPGTNYVYGKVLVDAPSGGYVEAHIYTVTSEEEPDGTYAYLLIGQVTFDQSATPPTLSIEQAANGDQSLLVFSTADGSTLTPFWSVNSSS